MKKTARYETELKQIEQNFPPVVPDSFALLGFAEIAENDDMGLLWILESIESKSRIFLIAERFLKRYNNLVTLSRRTVT